jgi:hypothetical protein
VDMIDVLFTLIHPHPRSPTLTLTLIRNLVHPQSENKYKDAGLILQKNIQALSLKIAVLLLRILNFDTFELVVEVTSTRDHLYRCYMHSRTNNSEKIFCVT